MSTTIFPDGKPGMGSTDFNIQVRIADRIADDFKRPSRSKDSKGAGNRNPSGSRKSSSCPHQILFGNAHVKIPFRSDGLEVIRFCRSTQIGFQDDDFRVFIDFSLENIAICGTSSCPHYASPPSSFNACAHCS